MTAPRGAAARASWRLIPLFAWRILARRRGAGGAAGGSAYLTGAAVGIGLSLVPLMVVMEVSDGLIEGITRRFLEVGSYHLQVRLPPGMEVQQRVRAELLDEVAARLQQGLGDGALATRERHGIALAAAGGRSHVVTVRAVIPELYERDPGLRQYLAVASGAFDLSGNGIVVSHEVARQLDAQVGDRLLMVTAIDRGAGTGQALLIPKLTPLEVRGIVSSGYQELDKLWVFVSHATAEVLLPPGGSRDFVGVKIADPFADLNPAIERTASLAGPGYAIYTWRQLERANYESFATSRALLLLIMALIVAVAGVNVSSATVTIALARRREMAFLKSQGLPPEVVFWTLTASGLLAGALGAAVGIGAGLAAALNINQLVAGMETVASVLRTSVTALLAPAAEAPAAVRFFDRGFYLEHIPIAVEPGPVAIVAGATIALAGFAAALPAARAAGRMPLELLRGVSFADVEQGGSRRA